MKMIPLIKLPITLQGNAGCSSHSPSPPLFPVWVCMCICMFWHMCGCNYGVCVQIYMCECSDGSLKLMLLFRIIFGSFFHLIQRAGSLNQTQSLPICLVWLASLFWWSLSLFSEAGIIRRPPSLPAFMWASMDPKCSLYTWVAGTWTTEPFS